LRRSRLTKADKMNTFCERSSCPAVERRKHILKSQVQNPDPFHFTNSHFIFQVHFLNNSRSCFRDPLQLLTVLAWQRLGKRTVLITYLYPVLPETCNPRFTFARLNQSNSVEFGVWSDTLTVRGFTMSEVKRGEGSKCVK